MKNLSEKWHIIKKKVPANYFAKSSGNGAKVLFVVHHCQKMYSHKNEACNMLVTSVYFPHTHSYCHNESSGDLLSYQLGLIDWMVYVAAGNLT